MKIPGRMIALCVMSLAWPTAIAGTVVIPGFGSDIQLGVSSFKEQQFRSVIQQQYDFSCGSAAVASLLSFHYGHDVTEQDVFEGMLALADEDKVRREGFSMLDMKRYLESEGYSADGFRMPLSGIREKVRVPVIALISLEGYRHFVIIKGISKTEVLVGDPARGLKVYPRDQFEKHWNGAAFVIRSHLQHGRSTFQDDGQWPMVVRAPLSRGQQGPSLSQTLPHWPSSREW
ncbi:C39 family peptidase [Marinobacter salinexigens]|uniref:C39 family peptidase n=1 Tax=Marinobacter salinexigens TaxID=2919747 RepID=A0A5B0VNA1_9GAMM|nr:C39 family peptidase [Marinobacter salinexigens]KAA1175675.1 C39 family peptidase [Marinobacter salinexigens]